MCGCCCSDIDYDYGSQYCREQDDYDIYSFNELDGEKLFATYYYNFRYDEILRKNDYGTYFKIRSLMTRDSVNQEFSKTHCMLTDKNGKILIYCHYTLKNKLKEAYHQNIRNKVREEVRKELSANEPLLSI